jgi:hypothetical protein
MVRGGYNMSYTYQPQVFTKPTGEISRAIVGKERCAILHRHIGHIGIVNCLLDDINERARCHIAL